MKPKGKVALFDVDDTLYKGGLIFPLMESEVQSSLLDKKYVDEVYNVRELYRKGDLQYEELSRRVVISWANGLKDQSYDKVALHAKDFIENDLNNFYSFTKPLLNLLQQSYDLVVITNEPQFVAEPIQKIFNFGGYVSTFFEVNDGKLTGNVSRFNSTQTDKKKSIHEVFENYDSNHSFAFGDSIGDIGMFEEVTYPICVNASQKLQEVAKTRGWILTNSDNIMDIITKIVKNTSNN